MTSIKLAIRTPELISKGFGIINVNSSSQFTYTSPNYQNASAIMRNLDKSSTLILYDEDLSYEHILAVICNGILTYKTHTFEFKPTTSPGYTSICTCKTCYQ